MPRGGARIGAGRPPSQTSLAESIRLESGAIRTLPRTRRGNAPAWPLSKATTRETTVWRALWKLPQAIVWDENFMHRQVAFYVRTSVEAEEIGHPVSRRNVLLRQENELLLSHAALLRAGYRISTNARPAAAAAAPTGGGKKAATPKSNVVDFRERLRGTKDVEPAD